MLELLDGPYDIPFDKAPYYSVLFSIAVVILIFAFFRKRGKRVEQTSISADQTDIQQLDVLGQPQRVMPYIPDQKEGIIFSPLSKKALNRYKIYGVLAAIITLVYIVLNLYFV